MKVNYAIPLAVLLFAGVSLNAQEAPKETKPAAAPSDPFLKEKQKKAEDGGDGPATHTNVGVVVQYIDVKHERWQGWLAENHTSLDATPLRKEVETWIAAGDANLAESSLVMGKSGQRAKVESVRNLIYPADFSEDPKGPPFPKALEPRNAGTTTEADLIVDTDGVLDINFAPERVVYAGENPPHKIPGVLDGDLRHPIFGLQKATLSGKLDAQGWVLVGCEQSLDRADTHLTLIFTRALLHRFEEASDNVVSGSQGMLTWSWLEVTHESFNASLMKLVDPSSWIGGGLNEEVRNSGARILEERSHLFQSGLRSKNESIREMRYPSVWEKAKDGGSANPTAFEARNVGTTVEIDPVISATGRMLDLNLAPEITTFSGWDTLHRVKVGTEWNPNVTVPAFYRIQPSTQLSLPLDTPVLVAVMSPPDEKGWTDPSRKVLLFVKFSR